MLINFNFRNFRSISKDCSFSMEAAPTREPGDSIHMRQGYKLLPVSVFYGANSSGKSNVLQAMMTMRQLVLQSVKLNPDDELHYEPFELNTHSPNEPTMFEVQFIQDDVVYRYGFEYDRTVIHKEWLFEKRAGEREFNLFARIDSDFDISEKRFPEGIGKESSTERNRLFISLVAQLKGEISKSILAWFRRCAYLWGLTTDGYEGFTIKMLKEKTEGYRKAMQFFHHVQLGFNDISFSEEVLIDLSDKLNIKPGDARDKIKDQVVFEIEMLTSHNVYGDDGSVVGQKNFSKDDKESEGTKKVIEMSGPIFDTLLHGKLLLVDEIDAKLHPLLTMNIVKLFMNKDTNPNGAQLIFTTHDTHLLNLSLLRRDMVWFTEKDSEESTDIYSLAEFKDVSKFSPRDVEKDYIDGRYGAIPFMQ